MRTASSGRASWLVVGSGITSGVRAFLSHASEDKASFVEPLARHLAEMGVEPWLDKWEIRPGDSLVEKLFDEGIDTVSAVIVVVSASSAGKPWVREELDAAVVRRITDRTRLIPVRLEDASMPAPLRHLLWITAERTPEGARTAAAQIADTLYGRDLRPAVASPPAYAASPSIPGLAPADSALLSMLIAEALDAGSLVVVWPIVKAKAEARHLTGDALEEAFSALEQRRYLKVRAIAGGPHTVELSAAAFRRGVDSVVPDAEAARRQIIATLANDPPASDQPVHELATSTGKPFLFVLQFLRQLEAEGYVQLAGLFRITVRPTLKRLLDAS
jgi:TIR domain